MYITPRIWCLKWVYLNSCLNVRIFKHLSDLKVLSRTRRWVSQVTCLNIKKLGVVDNRIGSGPRHSFNRENATESHTGADYRRRDLREV
jgi:hypothetical protein